MTSRRLQTTLRLAFAMSIFTLAAGCVYAQAPVQQGQEVGPKGNFVRTYADGRVEVCFIGTSFAAARLPDGTIQFFGVGTALGQMSSEGAMEDVSQGAALIGRCDMSGLALPSGSAEYTKFTFSHRMNAFKWQLLSSRLIFFVVLALVAIGVGLAVAQFYLAYRPHRPFNLGAGGPKAEPRTAASVRQTSPPHDHSVTESNQERDSGPRQEFETDLSISPTGLHISSRVLGVIILVLSMAFLYLYLKYVYQIQVLSDSLLH